jgi:hypothetical protein
MWPMQPAFLLFTVRSTSLSSSTSRNTSSFLARSVQMTSHVLLQHHTSTLQTTCTITKKEQRIKIRRQISSTLDRRLRFVRNCNTHVPNSTAAPLTIQSTYNQMDDAKLDITTYTTGPLKLQQPSFRSCYQPATLKISRLSWKPNFHYSTHKSTNGPHPESH